MELKINNQYILFEKNNDYIFKALINDVTKTSIQITNLDNNSGPVRTLLTAFHEKLDVIEFIDDKQIESQIVNSINQLKELYDNPIKELKDNLEIESAMMNVFLENQKPLEPDYDVIKEAGKDKPISFVSPQINVREHDNIISDEPDYIQPTKPLTNNWCVQVTEENKELIEGWLGFAIKSKNIGCYYGINKSGIKVFNYETEGWSGAFSELISTEQFTKYIFNITEETEEFFEKEYDDVKNNDYEKPTIDDFDLKKSWSEADYLSKGSLTRQTKNNIKEIWKPVKETNGVYVFSNKGQLKKVSTGKIIKREKPNKYKIIMNKITHYLYVNTLQETYFP